MEFYWMLMQFFEPPLGEKNELYHSIIPIFYG